MDGKTARGELLALGDMKADEQRGMASRQAEVEGRRGRPGGKDARRQGCGEGLGSTGGKKERAELGTGGAGRVKEKRGGLCISAAREKRSHTLKGSRAAREAQVDLEVVKAVIAILEYELEVRKALDPIDAENSFARMEERIRRALSRGRMNKRQLQQATHASRYGKWIFTTALNNLIKDCEVDHKNRREFWLIQREV